MQRVRRLLLLLAWLYPAALVAAILIMRYGGQSIWQAELALYLPRIGFALPLPFFVIALLIMKQRRALWSQAIAAWLVLFPLMGLVLPGFPRSAEDPKRTLKILVYNGNFLYSGAPAVAAQIRVFSPDIVLMQQTYGQEHLQKALGDDYAAYESDGEFMIASRYPVRSQWRPPNFWFDDRSRTTRSIRYEVDTNLGRIVIHSFHPASPQNQIRSARNGGLRRGILSGALLGPRPEIQRETVFRGRQVRIVSGLAKREKLPVIVAGDTNLPKLSAPLADLADFQDGFAEVGAGFGYTFPNKHPWMRIDRIFASDHFRFIDFDIGKHRASDHHCVTATLELAR